MKAKWNNKIIAKSDKTLVVESNHYFPPDSISKEFFKESKTTTVCSWKGTASYYNLEVDGSVNQDAAWYYPNPLEDAARIKNYVAFWKGVEITE